jgi:UDP-N-acetyl-D-mannosaminuronic acid dehydrogenase
MAFKGDSDDTRDSLSFKLRKLLSWAGSVVLCTDPYVADERFLPVDRVLDEAELLVVGAPHRVYLQVEMPDKPLIDVWGITPRGISV